MRVIRTGIPTAGIAVGTAFVLERHALQMPSAEAASPETETARFRMAMERAKEELEVLAAGNAVFAAHREMADDPLLAEQVEERIAHGGVSAGQALGEACAEICGMLEALDDAYLRGRVDDVRDVCARIRRILSGEPEANPFAELPPGTIVVARELAPSDTALMDFSRIAGLVTERGSRTSHVCIIARNKGVAALVGVPEATREIKTGDRLIINGECGELFVCPDAAAEREYGCRAEILRQEAVRSREGAQAPAVTRSGRKIAVLGNAGSVEEVREALDAGAGGIGLFRSEFLYMQGDAFPGEAEQFEAYRAAAELCGERPLIIRTLDVGGDKALPYMHFEHEENPFLGWRAIRVSLAMRDVFRTQLRALLRAGACGNVKIMFPMIASVGEFREAKAAVAACMAELEAEHIAFKRDMELGVMIETPAAVLIADLLAAEAHFFSIGTNDLTQYIMAADRGNPRVAYLCDPFDVAVERSVGMAIAAARHAGIEVGMCGELAAAPRATQLLLSLGLEEFSVSPPAVGALKQRIRNSE
ncbi:phosphoenolpyruvate--protein phosphotransferase [uncultured Alistipes sp.]|uniref:phosphoenolpyruvate--protein phosphotransferase n=1 Tax=uncultured Alistipes sp. TaxID=538949 RepID=UPI0026053C26|nr:phosphoenolpyruvate--protein phosphotransferase [uncultured Alistipes sp.]